MGPCKTVKYEPEENKQLACKQDSGSSKTGYKEGEGASGLISAAPEKWGRGLEEKPGHGVGVGGEEAWVIAERTPLSWSLQQSQIRPGGAGTEPDQTSL